MSMNSTAIAICFTQLATPIAGAHPTTSSPTFSVTAPAKLASTAATGADTNVETFALSPDELEQFHRLNLNPPSVTNQLIEVFRATVAQS